MTFAVSDFKYHVALDGWMALNEETRDCIVIMRLSPKSIGYTTYKVVFNINGKGVESYEVTCPNYIASGSLTREVIDKYNSINRKTVEKFEGEMDFEI